MQAVTSPTSHLILGYDSGYQKCYDGNSAYDRRDCPEVSGGFPFLPFLLALGLITFVFVRAKQKGLRKREYIQTKIKEGFKKAQESEYLQQKAEQAKEIYDQSKDKFSAHQRKHDSSEIIRKSVDEYKSAHPEIADSISYTNSSITGGFIAIRDMEGRLIAEIPVPKES